MTLRNRPDPPARTFQPAPDRLFVILTAGNLATTQELMNHQRDIEYPTGAPNPAKVRYLFEAAEYVGRVSQQVQQAHGPALAASGVIGRRYCSWVARSPVSGTAS